MTDLDGFIEQVTQRPMPQAPLARVRLLARELAEGATLQLWDTTILMFRGTYSDATVRRYVQARWDDAPPSVALLVSAGYLTVNAEGNPIQLTLTGKALDLLESAPPATLFISYKRSESSAFALLLLARLKAAGLNAFLDLSIEAGDQWQALLQERIHASEAVLLLLGPQSLHSAVTRQEIAWALAAGKPVLPVWHNGFRYESAAWREVVGPQLDALLSGTHTIRVMEESALAYNNAIVELLNRFGITPD